MPYPTNVKMFYYDPGMTSINGLDNTTTNHTLVTVLDACLVDGYGLKNVDSVVVAGGIATVTISTGHEYGKWQVALIEGATPAEINGEKRILSVTANSFTFDATGVADQTATGTITSMIAPLGWVREFTGTGKRAYRIDTVAHPTAPAQYLRVDDTFAQAVSIVTLFESMTDVDTGVDRTPTPGQFTAGINIHRTNTTATNVPWVIIGDGRCFYVLTHYDNPPSITPTIGAAVSFFGEAISPDNSDNYRFIIAGNHSNNSLQASGNSAHSLAPNNGNYIFRARSANGVTKSQRTAVRAGINNTNVSGAQTGSRFSFPDLATGKIILCKHFLRETERDFAYNGELPGYYFIENGIGSSLHSNRIQRLYDETPSAFPNRVLAYLLTVHSGATPGVSAFDIIGPWR